MQAAATPLNLPLPDTAEDASGNSALQDRLMALEVKASFMEDLLDELDKVVARQQLQIDALMPEVRTLRERERERQPESGPSAMRNLRDELPPHY